ncbi:hypothetical protein CHCC14814_0821 [Bacillus paralicheniformis]|nr:hypothetical protein CHCC14814_0821 [Bacillus paralicheniformis]
MWGAFYFYGFLTLNIVINFLSAVGKINVFHSDSVPTFL